MELSQRLSLLALALAADYNSDKADIQFIQDKLSGGSTDPEPEVPGDSQIIKIKFINDFNAGFALAGWNVWRDSQPMPAFKNDSGAQTTIMMQNVPGPLNESWNSEAYNGAQPGDIDFPDEVLQSSMYNNPPFEKDLQLVGLDPGKAYDLLWGAFKTYDGDTERTLIHVDDQVKPNGLPNGNVVYKALFTVLNPAGGIINIKLEGDPEDNDQRYPMVSALIIKEYSI
jgi:hypothetical protein